jgi:hypothetical protein
MELVSLEDMVLAVADNLRELSVGVTTDAMSTPLTAMRDTGRANQGKDRWWQGSQVLLLGSPAGLTAAQPFTVMDFNSATGTFTLDKAFGATGVPQGVNYALIRQRGHGVPYTSYLRALRYALDRLDSSGDVVDTSLDTAASTWEYTLPATVDTVFDVELDNGTVRQSLPPRWWGLAPGRTLVLTNRKLPVANAYTIRVHGRKWAALPSTLAGTVRVNLDELVDRATERLTRSNTEQREAARGAFMAQELARLAGTYPYPNEQEVIP